MQKHSIPNVAAMQQYWEAPVAREHFHWMHKFRVSIYVVSCKSRRAVDASYRYGITVWGAVCMEHYWVKKVSGTTTNLTDA